MQKILRQLAVVCLALGSLLGTAHAEREVVDRIVAIVGSDVILASELASQLQVVAFQTNRRPQSEAELKKFRDEVLDQMVTDRLFLIEARKDTSISVRQEEIDQALEEQVQKVSSRFPSTDAFQEALDKEGITLRELKRRYRTEIENQLLKQRLIQKKLMTVSVSKHEVEEFYSRFKDSIPSQPEAVRLAHLLLLIKPSQRVEDSVKALAGKLRQRILGGADFASISSQYSSMGAGVNGGDLGYVGREDLDSSFARAAFNLAVGEISGVIRTSYGYHIIKNEGKKEDRLHLRHVLLAVQPSAQDTTRVFQLADSLMSAARQGSDFAELAKSFSDDNDTRAQGGELGWFSVKEMPAEFAEAVAGWNTPGEFKGPVISRNGVHILKLLEYQPEKHYTLDQDFDRIKDLARQDKTGKLVDKWLADIKSKTFIEYHLEA